MCTPHTCAGCKPRSGVLVHVSLPGSMHGHVLIVPHMVDKDLELFPPSIRVLIQSQGVLPLSLHLYLPLKRTLSKFYHIKEQRFKVSFRRRHSSHPNTVLLMVEWRHHTFTVKCNDSYELHKLLIRWKNFLLISSFLDFCSCVSLIIKDCTIIVNLSSSMNSPTSRLCPWF